MAPSAHLVSRHGWDTNRKPLLTDDLTETSGPLREGWAETDEGVDGQTQRNSCTQRKPSGLDAAVASPRTPIALAQITDERTEAVAQLDRRREPDPATDSGIGMKEQTRGGRHVRREFQHSPVHELS
ncbi:hypothetical protein GCM10028789_11410 [Sinomonas halotolerans]